MANRRAAEGWIFANKNPADTLAGCSFSESEFNCDAYAATFLRAVWSLVSEPSIARVISA
jgi:hypothetical protein